MGGIARHKDQIQLGIPEDLVGELVPVGAAGEADGWAKAHRMSLRGRPGALYRSDTTRLSKSHHVRGRFYPPLSPRQGSGVL
jgi:hypothetical protein